MSWSAADQRDRSSASGFTLIEAIITVAVLIIVSLIAIPIVQSVSSYYRLKSAVASVTGAIQSTRYQAISKGYAYKVIIDKTASTLQIQSDPTRTSTFANIGGPIPLSGSSIVVALDQDTTYMLRPSGIIQPLVGGMTMTLTLQGRTETITVSSYGNIKVTP